MENTQKWLDEKYPKEEIKKLADGITDLVIDEIVYDLESLKKETRADEIDLAAIEKILAHHQQGKRISELLKEC